MELAARDINAKYPGTNISENAADYQLSLVLLGNEVAPTGAALDGCPVAYSNAYANFSAYIEHRSSSAQKKTMAKTDDDPAPRTVMVWIAGNSSLAADFILTGAGKGAVNAVSVGGLFGLEDNATDVWLTVDEANVAAHRKTWQEGAAKAAGIRTFPSINLIHHGVASGIFAFRVLVQPRVQRTLIAQLTSAIVRTDVDGLNIDWEPPLPPPNPEHAEPDSPVQPTFEDGLAFASFVDALAKAMHALPGRRRLLTVDSGSVAGACWSIGPLDHGKHNRTQLLRFLPGKSMFL